MTQAGYEQAESHLRRAIDLEPMFAEAIATLADVILRQALSGSIQNTHAAHQEARDLARRAVALQPDNGSVLATAAWALAGTREWDEALSLTEQARHLQPSSAHVRFRCGAIFVYNGECENAIGEFAEGWRLNPKDKRGYHPHVGIATAHFFERRFEKAIAWARRGMAETNAVAIPQRFIAASLAHLGRLSEARETIEALLGLQPNACLTRARTSSYRHQWMLDLYVDGLREAGLPEHPR
jgi:adenylate cyclase